MRGVVEQRAGHRLLGGVERAVLAVAHAGAHHRHAHAGHDRAHVGEVEVDEARGPGSGRRCPARPAAARSRPPGTRRPAGVPRSTTESSRWLGIAMSVSTTPRSASMPASACCIALAALEHEGLGDDGHGEDAEVLGQRGHHRRGPGAGAAAEPGRDEHHVGALEQPRDLLGILQRGVASHLGIRAGAQPLRELRRRAGSSRAPARRAAPGCPCWRR